MKSSLLYVSIYIYITTVYETWSFCFRNGRLLGVCASVDNCRLFVGGIPKTKKKEEILAEMRKVTEGVIEVIVYPSAADKNKNRGFAFVEYESHRAAAMARRKLLPGKIQNRHKFPYPGILQSLIRSFTIAENYIPDHISYHDQMCSKIQPLVCCVGKDRTKKIGLSFR